MCGVENSLTTLKNEVLWCYTCKAKGWKMTRTMAMKTKMKETKEESIICYERFSFTSLQLQVDLFIVSRSIVALLLLTLSIAIK